MLAAVESIPIFPNLLKMKPEWNLRSWYVPGLNYNIYILNFGLATKVTRIPSNFHTAKPKIVIWKKEKWPKRAIKSTKVTSPLLLMAPEHDGVSKASANCQYPRQSILELWKNCLKICMRISAQRRQTKVTWRKVTSFTF